MLAVAFIGKQNEPLFFNHIEASTASFDATSSASENLNILMIMHSSLDIVDERKKKASLAAPSTFDLYLGPLLQVDDYRVFGHYSNTHIKTVVLCEGVSETADAAVRDVVLALRGLYISAIQNPFLMTDKPMESLSFRRRVQQLIETFNSRIKS